VAIVKKPADKDEILSALDYFKPDRVTLFIFKDSLRIESEDVKKWFLSRLLTLEVLLLDTKALTRNSFILTLDKLDAFQAIAIPIGNHRAFYKSVPLLKKKGIKIIHVSDGVIDAFSLFGFCMSVKWKNFKSLFKLVVMYFEFLQGKADYCFFQLYPLPACLAKHTLPLTSKTAGVLPKSIMKLILEKKVATLLLPGWGEDEADLQKTFNLKSNYCATTKSKHIIINGQQLSLDTFITAEDVIHLGIIDRIYATASTAVYYAKLVNPDIYCKVLLNGYLNRQYGQYYEYFFRKKGQELGIEFTHK